MGRVAVDHHDRRAHEQRRDERVPHHPGGRREPLQPVAGLQVPAQAVVLQVLEQDAAVAVHDRLREPGRARGEEHVERVRERQRLELERPLARPGARPRRQRVGEPALRVRDFDDGLEAREPLAHRGDLLATVDQPIAPAVAGDGEQELRLELAEPVEDAADAELRRARRPDRAEARAGEEGDERLRDVRQVGDDAVAGADAEPLQPGAGAGDLVAELAERQLERLARLRVRDDRDRVEVVVAPDHVLGEVQPRAREPLRARHRRASRARARRARAPGSRRTPRATTRSLRGR